VTLHLSLLSSLLIWFGGRLLVPLQFFNVFLELEGPKLDTVGLVGWSNHIPWSAGCTLTAAAQDAVFFHCSKATLLSHA